MLSLKTFHRKGKGARPAEARPMTRRTAPTARQTARGTMTNQGRATWSQRLTKQAPDRTSPSTFFMMRTTMVRMEGTVHARVWNHCDLASRHS